MPFSIRYSYPQQLTNANGTVYFRDVSAAGSGSTLWRSDGTAAGTIEVPKDTFSTRSAFKGGLHYAVVGTPNRLEYDQGFFVKGGDGLADVKPIAHLYKSQVYQLAEYLGVPVSVTSRPPTTDTFSLPQSQEEFYYNMPTQTLDIVLHARNEGRAADDVSQEIGFTVEQVERAYADIDQKRMTTRYLHLGPQLVEPVVTSSSPGPV